MGGWWAVPRISREPVGLDLPAQQAGQQPVPGSCVEMLLHSSLIRDQTAHGRAMTKDGHTFVYIFY